MLIYCVLACFIASQVKNLNVYRENHTQRIIYIFDPPPQLEEKKIVEKKDCRGGWVIYYCLEREFFPGIRSKNVYFQRLTCKIIF